MELNYYPVLIKSLMPLTTAAILTSLLIYSATAARTVYPKKKIIGCIERQVESRLYNVCYTAVSDTSWRNFSDANGMCSDIKGPNSSLAAITNEDEQKLFSKKFGTLTSDFSGFYLIGARYHKLDNWQWLNSIDFTDFGIVETTQGDKSRLLYVMIDQNGTNTYKRVDDSGVSAKRLPVISAICNNEVIYFNSTSRINAIGWYKARNDCLRKHDDLASTILPNLSQDVAYYIGVRAEKWTWGEKITDVEVKYTNWRAEAYGPSDEISCVIISSTSYKWDTVDCSRMWSKYICETATVLDTTTVSTTTTKAAIGHSPTTPPPSPSPSSATTTLTTITVAAASASTTDASSFQPVTDEMHVHTDTETDKIDEKSKGNNPIILVVASIVVFTVIVVLTIVMAVCLVQLAKRRKSTQSRQSYTRAQRNSSSPSATLGYTAVNNGLLSQPPPSSHENETTDAVARSARIQENLYAVVNPNTKLSTLQRSGVTASATTKPSAFAAVAGVTLSEEYANLPAKPQQPDPIYNNSNIDQPSVIYADVVQFSSLAAAAAAGSSQTQHQSPMQRDQGVVYAELEAVSAKHKNR